MENPIIILIRPYKAGDQAGVQAVIAEGTMSTVGQFFLQSLMREIFFQSIIMVSAIMFILLGVPFYWTITSIPIVILSFFLIIWASHYYKANYLHTDLKDISRSYMGSRATCFFVAEAFGPSPSAIDRKTNPPAFLTESEFEKMNRKLSGGVIIGTVGITRDRDSAVIAWLRRMAVRKEWRKMGVGERLLETVIKFCNQKAYVGIELVTTECHGAGRKLYEKKGFELKQLYHKKFLGLSSLAVTMYFMSYKAQPSTGTAADL